MSTRQLAIVLALAPLVAPLAPHAGLRAAAPPAAATEPTTAPAPDAPIDYLAAAREVTAAIQRGFYRPSDGLYVHALTKRDVEHIWGSGVMFAALLGAARHEPDTYRPLVARFFTTTDRYWDAKANVPGYEPLPTRGGGNDKYYDDNAWLVLSFTEAFEMTGDRRYLRRAQQTLDFVRSGWDEQLGGGIWWHERHKDGSKNTCSNAPAAVACLRVAAHQPPARAAESIATARKIVDWTNATLRADNGLYNDRVFVATAEVNTGRLTYNTALMIRAMLGLHRATGDAHYLAEAKRSAAAADWFEDKRARAYRDPPKWSHLMIEADLELHRATGDAHLLRRATRNANHLYARWKTRRPDTLIDNAAVARALWLMADTQTASGRAFWARMDRRKHAAP